MLMRLVVLVGALVFCAPVAASAAVWSSPVDVGPAADGVSYPSLAFSGSGSGAVGWFVVKAQPGGGYSTTFQGDNDGESGRFGPLTRAGFPGRVQRLRDSVIAGPLLDAAGRGLLLRSHILSVDDDLNERRRITWSRVGPDGTLGRPRPLVTAILQGVSLAANARGDAIAVWTEVRPPAPKALGDGRFRIRAAWKPAGHGFGSPRTLFVTRHLVFENNTSVSAAIGRSGRAIVAFADSQEVGKHAVRKVLAWTGTARAGFGPPRTVGPSAGFADFATAVTDGGRSIVAWGTQDGGEEANVPWTVRAATLARGAARFSPPQLLDRATVVNRPFGNVAMDVAPDGRATLAWSDVTGSRSALRFPVLTATSDAAGHFGTPQELAPSGAVGGVAVRRDGAAIVTWARAVDYLISDQAQAAVRAARATAFGPAEEIAAPDVAGPPVAAFNPRTGRPTAAWSSRPNGVDPSKGYGRTAVLRFAARAAP